MVKSSTTAILSAERLGGGVVVTFVDGRSVLFSSTVLYATIPLGEELTHLPNPDDL